LIANTVGGSVSDLSIVICLSRSTTSSNLTSPLLITAKGGKPEKYIETTWVLNYKLLLYYRHIKWKYRKEKNTKW
jgi:hypothetical protein